MADGKRSQQQQQPHGVDTADGACVDKMLPEPALAPEAAPLRPAAQPRPAVRCRSEGTTTSSASSAILRSKPIHNLWTSAAAAMSPVMSNRSEDEEAFFPADDKADRSAHGSRGTVPLTQPLSRDSSLDHSFRAEDCLGRPPLSPRSTASKSSDNPNLQQRNPSVTMEDESAVHIVDHASRDLDESRLSPPQLTRLRGSGKDFPSTNGDHELDLPKLWPAAVPKPPPHVLRQRQPLQAGVKVAVPISPVQPKQGRLTKRFSYTQFQMGTVVSSQRIFVPMNGADRKQHHPNGTNCLSVTVKLDKFFLRNAEFAELTFRVMDAWGPRYMPKCSQVPIGACVATKYGLGVLVGWRVEGDCHVIRSLWNRRGAGSAHAYLNRDAIFSTIEAAVGFEVRTRFGRGDVIAFVDGARSLESGKFLVSIKDEGRHYGRMLEIPRSDIYACHGSQFIPIIEHIREAALYQIQVDNYAAALREQLYSDASETSDPQFWRMIHECGDILWDSFLAAVEEDKDFDEGMNEFMSKVIDFLERLDAGPAENEVIVTDELIAGDFAVECISPKARYLSEETDSAENDQAEPGLWIVNDIFGGLFKSQSAQEQPIQGSTSATFGSVESQSTVEEKAKPTNFDRAFAIIRTLMRTVSIAKASSVDHPHFQLALTVVHEVLLFVRNVLKVIQKNRSSRSTEIWKQTLEDFSATFGPMKARVQKIIVGIAQRMEKQGRKAKVRALKFVDTIINDEKLLFAMEQGEWTMCISRLEIALIKSQVVERESLFYYHKAAQYIFDHIQSSLANNEDAATRNNAKMAVMGHLLQAAAAPKRSTLKLMVNNRVLEIFERILVRVYCQEELASRMLTIHASNFHSLRHLRILKDISVAGRMWRPLLDAADQELSWLVSNMPENSKDFMCPLSSLFSLLVARFHKMALGELSEDWLDFLLEKDAVRIIQDIDMKLLLALKTFSEDVKDVMVVLPYYSSIDEDILKLMDEVDLDEFVKEAADAIDDPNPEAVPGFLKEKATIAVERFLNYLPKMSIPVEKRDIGEGFVLTCRGHDGNDLTLSDVKIKRENLVCQILGGDSLFFPMFGDDTNVSRSSSPITICQSAPADEEDILDHIRVLLLNAQAHGCLKPGIGGVEHFPADRYVASVLKGLPVSSVLNCAIELWRNLEIDDDELLEVAIRDISHQIQLQQKLEEGSNISSDSTLFFQQWTLPDPVAKKLQNASSIESHRRRFNPRADPTVLFLEMKNLTLNLNNFIFRIEKSEQQSIFDPVFEGRGMVSLRNISIRLRIDCAKQRVKKMGLGSDVAVPSLHIRELSVQLEDLKVKVKDTGFGSDWLLNRVVMAFSSNITKVVEENLQMQIKEQCVNMIENLNNYFTANPNMLLNILGISIDDLDDAVVWV